MKEHFNLSIPTPCHEKWSDFQATHQGGYCLSCKKEVIDFTKWSDIQIKEYFINIKEGTCGRFRKDQLRSYTVNNISGKPNTFLSTSLFGVALLLNSYQAEAIEKKIPLRQIVHLIKMPEIDSAIPSDTLGPKIITGVVIAEEDNSPIPGVNVVLKNANISTVTDADGKFKLEIPNLKGFDVLVFSFIGYESMEKRVSEIDESPIILRPDIVTLGETIVVGGVCARRWTPRAIWWRIKNIFR